MYGRCRSCRSYAKLLSHKSQNDEVDDQNCVSFRGCIISECVDSILHRDQRATEWLKRKKILKFLDFRVTVATKFLTARPHNSHSESDEESAVAPACKKQGCSVCRPTDSLGQDI